MAIDLQTVPKEKQTYAMCLDSVQADWGQLAFVREDLQTNNLCLCAIIQDADALQYVQNQTPELCMEAIKKSASSRSHEKNSGTFALSRISTKDSF